VRDLRSGRGRGGGRGRRFRGGRPRIQPHIKREWISTEGEIILKLTNVELEALRLVDKKKLTQEQAAAQMHISRGSLWRILQEARIKVISALTAGKSHIHIQILDEN
jgi:predicted DNA-binding protein (UPF0251 family)